MEEKKLEVLKKQGIDTDKIDIFYEDGETVCYGYCDGLYLLKDGNLYSIRQGSDYETEDDENDVIVKNESNDMHLFFGDRHVTTIFNFFSVNDVFKYFSKGSRKTSETGNTYQMKKVVQVLVWALDDGKGEYDLRTIEGNLAISILKNAEAVSEETAVDLYDYGIDNPGFLVKLIREGIIGRTKYGKYYLK